jgi:hypothetical protein
MAVTANVYNHTTALVLGQEVDLDNLKAMLLSDSASFTAGNTTVDQVAGAASPHRANEVYGNGWPEGGPTVANVAASTITTDDAKLAGDQIAETASGGIIGPCRYVLLYDATAMSPLILYDLGQDEYAGDTTPFKLTFDLSGTPGTILTLSI